MNAVLFDLDGTLTDPREGITRSIAHALERMGVSPPPLDDLVFAIGPPLRASLATLIGTEDRAAVEQALGHYRERFSDVGLFENVPYAGIGEALTRISDSGAALFVATSKPLVYAARIIERFGLRGHFRDVHGSELDGTRENKRELLPWLAARHGLDPATTTMVGDRGVDMAAARATGMRGIGALWGYGNPAELSEAGAHVHCEQPSQLPATWHTLWSDRAPR